jgi:epoxyqueuosine reductase
MSTAAVPSPQQLAAEFRELALSLGFDLVGIAPAGPSPHADFLRRWIAAGHAGEMRYMADSIEDRIDPARLLPGVRSILCVAMNYNPGEAGAAEASAAGRVARYARGDDYHDVLKKGLHKLADEIRARYPGSKTKCGVDISAILEREAAAATGIGWIGKNTCLIHPQLGSWLVLGEVMTTLKLEPDAPLADHCASCRRCLDACPTGALTAPYELDARRCISYLTLELQRPLEAAERAELNGWLVGCDICQKVCPWNQRAPLTRHLAFQNRQPQGVLPLADVLAWDEPTYRQRTRKSAIRRMKLPVLQDRARALLEWRIAPAARGGAGDERGRDPIA